MNADSFVVVASSRNLLYHPVDGFQTLINCHKCLRKQTVVTASSVAFADRTEREAAKILLLNIAPFAFVKTTDRQR